MKKWLFLSLLILFGLILSLYYCPYFVRKINEYAIKNTEQKFGAELVASEHETLIQSIAQEMRITEPIIVRKMNTQTMQLFGYYNAYAYFPKLLNCIPISTQPFLYISPGFFEDLSLQEQRFLIGHELIHIKDRHILLLNLILFSVLAIIMLMFVLFRKSITFYIERFISTHPSMRALIFFILLQVCLSVPSLVGLWYRRHMEWQADMQSIALLKSHEGGIKLMERWVKDFRVPWHHTKYAGLLTDHPSCFERRVYCLTCRDAEGKLT